MSPEQKFTYGSKVLSFCWDEERGTVSVRFGSRFFLGRKFRKKNETTICFGKIDRYMAQLANERNLAITLKFDTANENLKNWARLRQEMFGFNIKPDEDAYRITVSKQYSRDGSQTK